ncbi:hypothetical protein E4U54_001313 [Claviceps lovelessii]|nr:hypothetical protein E4U54_001313 [Claviceps lovelessii]
MKFSTIASLVLVAMPAIASKQKTAGIVCTRSQINSHGTDLEFYRRALAELCSDYASCDGAKIMNKELPPLDGKIVGLCTSCPNDLHVNGFDFGICSLFSF